MINSCVITITMTAIIRWKRVTNLFRFGLEFDALQTSAFFLLNSIAASGRNLHAVHSVEMQPKLQINLSLYLPAKHGQLCNRPAGTSRRICSPDIWNVNALQVLRNHALQIDIYLLTYLLYSVHSVAGKRPCNWTATKAITFLITTHKRRYIAYQSSSSFNLLWLHL